MHTSGRTGRASITPQKAGEVSVLAFGKAINLFILVGQMLADGQPIVSCPVLLTFPSSVLLISRLDCLYYSQEKEAAVEATLQYFRDHGLSDLTAQRTQLEQQFEWDTSALRQRVSTQTVEIDVLRASQYRAISTCLVFLFFAPLQFSPASVEEIHGKPAWPVPC